MTPIDAEGCERGFMSVERMRILLGLDEVKSAVVRDQRQQITPAINFTCEGLIMKWVVGAEWHSLGNLFPELQLWRRTDNESQTYQKINGTLLTISGKNESGIYEFDDFSPILFRPGDIVGMFLPHAMESRLRIQSEDVSNVLNYYLPVENLAEESHIEEIDLEDTDSLQTKKYLPLVSVYISLVHSATSATTTSQSSPGEVNKTNSGC
jgi:hypothetical protein